MDTLQEKTLPPVRVLVVEDEPIFRLGLQIALRPYEDQVKVIGEAANSEDAVSLAQEQSPDVVLLDLRLPERRRPGAPSLEHGISAIQSIRTFSQRSRILILSYLRDTDAVFHALKAGAHGYIAKDDHFNGEELVGAIKRISSGEAIFGPTVAHLMHQFFGEQQGGQELSVEKLTAREHEVLELLAMNKTNDEIKDILVISESTVKTHVSSILAKLHLKSRHQVPLYSAFRQQKQNTPQQPRHSLA